MRRVSGARRVVEEERLVRGDGLRVHDELDGLVGDVLTEVVALLRARRLVHRVVVVGELGVPLARLGPEEAVPPLEAAARRPVAARRREVHLDGRAQVPLADHVGVPAPLAQDLGQHPVLGRDRAAGVAEPARALGDARHAVAGVVAARQQARAGRRAQRPSCATGCSERRRAAILSMFGRGDRTAVAAHRGEPHIVQHDVEHARCPVPAPSAASNGDQSSTESRMSTLTVPLNGSLIASPHFSLNRDQQATSTISTSATVR